MIFVTVGIHTQGFERLVRATDDLAAVITEDVVIQYGSSLHRPVNAECAFDFADEAQIIRWVSRADVVVSHAGAGSILMALRFGKPLVIAPRSVRFHEHNDEHQYEIANAVSKQHRAVLLEDISVEGLRQAVRRAREMAIPSRSPSGSIQQVLQRWLDELGE